MVTNSPYPPRTELPPAVVPAPRPPLDGVEPPVPGASRLADYFELSRFYPELVEVAVWTDERGEQTILLGTREGRWRAIGFNEPAAAELLLWLGQLPGFDPGRLRGLTHGPVARTITLWRTPAVRP